MKCGIVNRYRLNMDVQIFGVMDFKELGEPSSSGLETWWEDNSGKSQVEAPSYSNLETLTKHKLFSRHF